MTTVIRYAFYSPITIQEEEELYLQETYEEYLLHETPLDKQQKMTRLVQEALAERDNELGSYLSPSLKESVTRLYITLVGNRLCAVADANRPLTVEELEELKDEISAQYSDGWGESFDEIDRYDTTVKVEREYDEEDEEEDDFDEEEEVDTVISCYPVFYSEDNMTFEVKTLDADMEPPVLVEKPYLQLSGEDGNIFSIQARAMRTFRHLHLKEESDAFTQRMQHAKSYDEALFVVQDFFRVG